MFFYDKDMERVMQKKKREVLQELEREKNRIIKELSGVDKTTMTRLRQILADYNQIEFMLNKRFEEIEKIIANAEIDTSSANDNSQTAMEYASSTIEKANEALEKATEALVKASKAEETVFPFEEIFLNLTYVKNTLEAMTKNTYLVDAVTDKKYKLTVNKGKLVLEENTDDVVVYNYVDTMMGIDVYNPEYIPDILTFKTADEHIVSIGSRAFKKSTDGLAIGGYATFRVEGSETNYVSRFLIGESAEDCATNVYSSAEEFEYNGKTYYINNGGAIANGIATAGRAINLNAIPEIASKFPNTVPTAQELAIAVLDYYYS